METLARKSKSLVSLTAGLEDEQKKLFRQKYDSSREIREHIAAILYDKLDKAIKDTEKKDSYETPNWGFAQADNLGYRRALREALSLLTFEYEVDHDR